MFRSVSFLKKNGSQLNTSFIGIETTSEAINEIEKLFKNFQRANQLYSRNNIELMM